MSSFRDAVARNRFVVMGRAGMDMFADPPGVKSEHARTFRSGLGGSSANIAAGLAKFGAHAALVTSVSDDAVGRFCLNELRHYGVDTAHVRSVGGEVRTSLAVYESVLEDFQNVIYRNNAADFQVTEADIEAVDLTAFGALVTTGTVFASEPSRSAHFRAFEHAHGAGIPVILDIDYRPYSWPSAEIAADVLSRAGAAADAVIGNDEEFGFMAGDMARGLDKARELAAAGAALVIYKMGEKGAITLAEGKEIQTGIYPVTALKPNGAGDSFMAGLLSGLAKGAPLREAVLRGSACATLVVSRPGCAPAMPDEADLAQFLDAHAGPTAA
ncbi:MAG: 5-dehydro-2-deoxygluconokinase [Pseudomonadota bacterium]